jgi:4-amino-4-deoxy-L-arabinose transferase-like glycosyltransferase
VSLAVLSPIIVFFVIFLVVYGYVSLFRKSLLISYVIVGVFITLITEILSVTKSVTSNNIFIAWLFALCISLLLLSNKAILCPNAEAIINALAGNSFIALPVLGIVVACGITALFAAPNNSDSMVYHLPRVMHWMQNQSVEHYATPILRQVTMPPWSGFAFLHLILLGGGDYFVNLVQWAAMVGNIIAASLLAQELGADIRGQWLSAAYVASLPMGILQASSTQNDQIVTFWVLCAIYFSLQALQSPRTIFHILAGASYGLAVLTKGTAYFYIIPYAIMLSIIICHRNGIKSVKHICMVMFTAILLNVPHYVRNTMLFGSIFGADDTQVVSNAYSLDNIISTVVKNSASQFETNIQIYNNAIYKYVVKLHNIIGIELNNPDITFPSTEFNVLSYYNHEDCAANPFHFSLILLCLLLIILMRKRWNIRQITYYYIIPMLAGFVLFSAFVRWQPWGSRLLLPFLVLGAPVLASVTFASKQAQRYCTCTLVLVLVHGFWLALTNESRPFWGEWSIFKQSRVNQYFMNSPSFQKNYEEVTSSVLLSGNIRIGMELSSSDWEYPLWVLLKKGSDKQFKLEHIHVTNATKYLENKTFLPQMTVVRQELSNKLVVE